MIRIIKYLASSLTSFAVDMGLFTGVNLFLAVQSMEGRLRLLIATATARIISSLVNYTMNRKLVFNSRESVNKSVVRYYILCVCQAFVSYSLVYIVGETLLGLNGGAAETLVKFGVDCCLFIASYNIQRIWVFKK